MENPDMTRLVMLDARRALHDELANFGTTTRDSVSEIIQCLSIFPGEGEEVTAARDLSVLQYAVQPAANKTGSKWLKAKISAIARSLGVTVHSPREYIKSRLRTTHDVRGRLDPLIQTYLRRQVEFLTETMARNQAEALAQLLRDLRAEHPNSRLALHFLKRHDESNPVHKCAGFNRDTGLTPICLPRFARQQSTFDLERTRLIHSETMRILKATGHISSVHEICSPVRRAYQTAYYSTFENGVTDSTSVDGRFAETNQFRSGKVRARALPPMAALLNGRANLDVTQIKRIGCSKAEHIRRAVEKFFKEPVEGPGTPVKFLIAHHAINRQMVDALREELTGAGKPCDIPYRLARLGYGEYYLLATVYGVEIERVAYAGHFTRDGLRYDD